MTHYLSSLFAVSALCALSSPALAIDCKKAENTVEKHICADKNLLKADAALGQAYKAIVKTAPDTEIRTMLVNSQKRWMTARDMRLKQVIDNPENLNAGTTSNDILLSFIEARTAELKARKRGGELKLIQEALDQQRFISQFTGGQFAGYNTSCDVLPRDNIYGCFAVRHYQNENRVCSVDEDWASGTVSVKRYIADITDGKPKLTASCSYNGDDAACPDSSNENAKWNMQPEIREGLYDVKPRTKIDGEITSSDDYSWLKTCLTNTAYPLTFPAKQ